MMSSSSDCFLLPALFQTVILLRAMDCLGNRNLLRGDAVVRIKSEWGRI
jgi:hypothetical protein